MMFHKKRMTFCHCIKLVQQHPAQALLEIAFVEQTNSQTRQITKNNIKSHLYIIPVQRPHHNVDIFQQQFLLALLKNHQEICAELQPQKFKVHSNGQASVVWLFVVGNSTREKKHHHHHHHIRSRGEFLEWNSFEVGGFWFLTLLTGVFVHHISFIQDFCSS